MDLASLLGENRRLSRAGVEMPVDRFSIADATEKAWDGSSWSSTAKVVDLENSMDPKLPGGSAAAFFCRVHPEALASGRDFFSALRGFFSFSTLFSRFVAGCSGD